jgi:hypothetical protein
VFTRQLTLPRVRADRPSAGKAAKPESFLFARIGAERSEELLILFPSCGRVLEGHCAEKGVSRKPRWPRPLAKVPKAAPTERGASSRLDDMRAYWIQVNVVDHARENRVVFQQDGVVATLKQMPTLLAEPVKSNREGTLEPMHPFGEVRLRRLQGKMEVISEEGAFTEFTIELNS